MAQKKSERRVSHPFQDVSRGRTTRQYQKLVIIFLVLSIAIVGLIVYLSMAKTLILVTPAIIRHPVSFTVRIQDELPEESSSIIIRGSIIQATIEDSITYSSIATKETTDGTARGTVTVHNNWSQNQPLVETTRLLSSEGILFRLDQSVTVPAGGSVENVPVYADQLGIAGDIKPTRFTIPGLWAGLQDQIYAESNAMMTGGTRNAKVLTADNIRDAKASLKEQMSPKAIDAIETEAGTVGVLADPENIVIVSQQLLSEKLSGEEGAEVDQLTVTQNNRYIAAIFNQSLLTDLAVTRAEESISAELVVMEIDSKSLDVSSASYNVSGNYAELQITADALATIRLSSGQFDRKNLTSKDTYEIQTYFSSFDEVENVEIRFSPFWLRKTPTLADHIEIRMNAVVPSSAEEPVNSETSNINEDS
ncbi:MAG: hypothetical protein A2898_04870 [Candidatus Kerfeldbacteria bacterium RIFCSPLOWO2_01_FULL_48_11]|uniref:Baseplate protein J-like domain-containing protein n=1 Tax=Candidatus Kerfeldbacteria bacterium RIFCSPLOWO2_01_FULL_48_11 TaxID=1798543 RepID=A0A1G2B1M9_9BACT|nr:MAG: hypothetical protein UY34_C0031G0007 [Parcubacteria group bacterium GW2011_GWA2_48_9]KKW15684.1 MAG: hypothetical protein UY52_C0016G0061 [Parcubacteria group bacterium GW2011_GWC2_49_9]OGY82885.1 MAG: hypothetical protein A2898_04870 [Candidatus Kerfeldbacteria bacterium RIFCSPLOWO2_01_FULL_48_11]HCJ52095.1 hypothetical protein [Candidatus Kerfeldbacteria bacterium]HCM68307.1 hypothetical protein [Candidatus Kerfeldbacteria bacterium]